MWLKPSLLRTGEPFSDGYSLGELMALSKGARIPLKCEISLGTQN